jgi:uncharacterized Zn finger protein
MCKHVAAVLYGIGARFDQNPELLFRLYEVDEQELIAGAGKELPLAKTGPARSKMLDSDDLSAMFGLDIAVDAQDADYLVAPIGVKPMASRAAVRKAKPGKKPGKP